MPTPEDKKKAAEEQQYSDFLQALKRINAQKQTKFEIMSSQDSKKEDKLSNHSVIRLKSNKGNIFTIENKVYPHAWFLSFDKSTKEERDSIRDLVFDMVANPKNPPKDYHPHVLLQLPKDTPEEEIAEFIDAAKERGIEVTLFLGSRNEINKIMEEAKKQQGGWNGLIQAVNKSKGGQEGKDFLENYRSGISASYRP